MTFVTANIFTQKQKNITRLQKENFYIKMCIVMKYYIINALASEKTKSFLRKYGQIVEIAQHPSLPVPEKHHADMQFAKIDDNCGVYAPNFAVSNTELFKNPNIFMGNTILKDKYPQNVAYNILRCGNIFFHNTNYTDNIVKEAIIKKGGVLQHVKQGYAGCSSICIPLENNKHLLLSSDKGIISTADKLQNDNIITEYFEDTKNILLPGYNHGFIGGCAGFDNELGLLIYGKINEQLHELSIKYNFTILSIFDNALTDIGGISVMYSNQ